MIQMVISEFERPYTPLPGCILCRLGQRSWRGFPNHSAYWCTIVVFGVKQHEMEVHVVSGVRLPRTLQTSAVE